MSGFNSGQRVSALEWDCTDHGGRKGTIPEPTQSAVEKFNRTVNDLLPGGLAALATMPPDEQEAAADMFKDAAAELCQGHPSRADLDEWPARVLTTFIGWLYGEITNPTSPAPDTKR